MRRADREALGDALRRVRHSTRQLVSTLEPAQRIVPALHVLNPPVWEYGHVGWFQERWCLRRGPAGRMHPPSRFADADRLFDASAVPHEERGLLELPSLAALDAWMEDVLRETLARLEIESDDDAGLYFHRLAFFHEAFHVEAMAMARQVLGLPQPGPEFDPPPQMTLSADVRVPGADVMIGSPREDGFAFDTEQPAHPVRIEPFEISLQPVTNAEFLQFVEDGGYHRARLWPRGAYAQLGASGRTCPANWRRVGERWQMRWFDRWIPLDPFSPVVNVDAFEAEAWCTWANRRLPTEAEWEHAAATVDGFDWGDSVWEWTSSPFVPFEGFEPGPYRDHAEPGFRSQRVVRGGSFATPRDLVDKRLRNVLRPDRHDAFTGFRSCAPR